MCGMQPAGGVKVGAFVKPPMMFCATAFGPNANSADNESARSEGARSEGGNSFAVMLMRSPLPCCTQAGPALSGHRCMTLLDGRVEERPEQTKRDRL